MTNTFTKEDFLTATKYAKKFHVARDAVSSLMDKLYKWHTIIPNDTQERQIIVKNRNSHNPVSLYSIHPLGLDEFKRRLDVELARGESK